MPRDLFGDVIDPSVRVGARKWYTVPLSLAVHSLIVAALVVVPLLATGTLPMPRSGVTFVPIAAPPLPSPPVVTRLQPNTPPAANPNAAPLEAPSTITAEPEIEPGFEVVVSDAIEIPGAGLVEGAGVLASPPVVPVEAPQKPVRPGGEVRAPEKIHDVAPVYPPIAQAVRIQGTVILEATIGVDGRVQDARVLRSVPMLDQAAIAAVQQWIYTPTLLNGVAVPVIMTVTVRFQLQ